MQNNIHEEETFENISYEGNDIANKEFEYCCFRNCNLSGAMVHSTSFVECTFTNCNLSLVKFKNCRIRGVSFKECKLLGADFSETADLFEIQVEDCMADDAIFAGKKIWGTPFIKSSLKNADFTNADLSKSRFADCNLDNATFNHTICKEVDFVSAVNYTIDPEQNNIRKAKFSVYGIAGLLAKHDIKIMVNG